MKVEKIQKVLEIYRKKFTELGVGKKDCPHEVFPDSDVCSLEHCHGMLEKIEQFIQEGRMDKVFRWLGFVQGVLWSQRIYTLRELACHNHKDAD